MKLCEELAVILIEFINLWNDFTRPFVVVPVCISIEKLQNTCSCVKIVDRTNLLDIVPLVADKRTNYNTVTMMELKTIGAPSLWDKEAADKRNLVSKWHPTTKGTPKRNNRGPSKSEGRRLLKAVASLLSDDDHFTDATSHKGCQIRRESAHGESICCKNVRALFDELPTPHLTVEITPFPAGPLTEIDYIKAEKLERVLRYLES
ncbi:protein piccolo-like [Hibiscus syriacus]|uniref:Protein piccolo-like n=1 Tax=Hibiscus syriacus TaxID=106335 RepID=A0A6A3B512_HIBSY|nr:protein piccolo-like [Hibiscus syriacus]